MKNKKKKEGKIIDLMIQLCLFVHEALREFTNVLVAFRMKTFDLTHDHIEDCFCSGFSFSSFVIILILKLRVGQIEVNGGAQSMECLIKSSFS